MKCPSFLLKDHRILKIVFIVLTIYLLIDEMRTFLITKPTLTSVTHTGLIPETFPNILICSEEGFDIDSLHHLGYGNGFFYGVGSLSNNPLATGWLGNQTKMNVTEVIYSISKIKTIKDCPKIFGHFKINGSYKKVGLREDFIKHKPKMVYSRDAYPRDYNY